MYGPAGRRYQQMITLGGSTLQNVWPSGFVIPSVIEVGASDLLSSNGAIHNNVWPTLVQKPGVFCRHQESSGGDSGGNANLVAQVLVP